MKLQNGKQSLIFQERIYIRSSAAVVGSREAEGPLGDYFDHVVGDPFFGTDTWEAAESRFLKTAGELAVKKAHLLKKEIRYAFAGDLLGQLIATSFGIGPMDIPVFGLYGACASIGSALALGSMTVAADYADHVLCLTSSHFCSAEKQFRFPLGYGNQKPLSATSTVTGSGAFVLSGRKVNETEKGIMIRGITPGKIVDYGIRDAQNMGAAMAPAAAEVIFQNLSDLETGVETYDRIITGDLGRIGSTALIRLLKMNGVDLSGRYMDCGVLIYDGKRQDTHSGGSGCACPAVVLSAFILKKMREGDWKRVLFVPTGALFSPVSFNEGRSIPAIAHAVILEREE